jgi:hypothetical protein
VYTSDTSASAQAIQAEVQKSLSGGQLLQLAFEMSLFARQLARACIQSEHPDWLEADIRREILRLSFLPHSLPAHLP